MTEVPAQLRAKVRDDKPAAAHETAVRDFLARVCDVATSEHPPLASAPQVRWDDGPLTGVPSSASPPATRSAPRTSSSRPARSRSLTDMVGGGPFGLRPGEWTDDTSMALCLAESLIACGGLDPAGQMRRYVRWMRDGHLSSTGTCFDIGNTTRDALTRFERTGEAVIESTDRNQAANGSLMRLAPVPMMFWQRDDVTDLCGESSRTTHPSPVPVDTCRYMGALIAGAIRGASKDELLRPMFSLRPDEWTRKPLEPEVADVASGSYLRKQPPQIRGTGYCVDALEAALWAFSASDDFRSGALLAVNLGDDADTTGAIYGQLAGAFYGESGIPAEWRSQLALWSVIDEYADALYRA